VHVTIVICTHNSGRVIGTTLRRLRAQAMDRPIEWEVIVVDYDSTDDTILVCRRVWGDCEIDLSVIAETKAGKSPALETGIEAARGEAVCIVDDDNFVAPDYIEVAYKTMTAHPDVGAIGAQGMPDLEVAPPNWFEAYSGAYALGHQASQPGYVDDADPGSFWGAGLVIRRSAWCGLKATGFSLVLNPSRQGDARLFKRGFTGGEDQEMCLVLQHAGYRLWYEPSLIFHHHISGERMTKEYLYRTTRGTALAIPVLKLYMSAFPARGFRMRVRGVLYRSLPLMLVHEILGALAHLGRASRSPFKLIEAMRALVRLKGCVLAIWDLAGEADVVLGQVKRVRALQEQPVKVLAE
jgi:glycosyltransferase involved in cell wall biosynthesis